MYDHKRFSLANTLHLYIFAQKRPKVSAVLVIQPDQDVRKRGRPRKVLDNTVEKPKKTRGRPKKATEEPSSETPVHQFIFQPPDTN